MHSPTPRKFDRILPFPESASIPEKIASQANEIDWSFRRPILNRLPDRLAVPVAHKYVDLHNAQSRYDANSYLLDVQENLSAHALSLAASDDDLCAYAKKAADRCSYYRMQINNPKKACVFLVEYVRNRYKINVPMLDIESLLKDAIESKTISVTGTVTDGYRYGNMNNKFAVTVTDTVTENRRSKLHPTRISIDGILNRLCDESWWRRMLRNITSRNVEEYSISLGLVHRKNQIYISDESMQRRQQQKRRHRKSMEKVTLTNELGQEYNLQELVDLSVANPTNRRYELMVRIRGTEEISKTLNHVGMFYTITCPSRMHARLSVSGDANPKYDGTSPLEAQRYLTKQWAQIRAQLARDETPIYGFRVVEPHHDGTPHWHLLFFMDKAHADSVTEVLRRYVMREDPDEKGAAEHRFTAIKVDPSKGSATGYIAKYISKNIDGYGVDDDLYGHDAKDSAKRISAWSSVWGIRQFQQIGGAPVTLYRELRRIQGNDLTGLLFDAWEAADKKNWQALTKLMGGATATRKEHPIKIARQWSDAPNKYLEPKGYEIIGVSFGNVIVPTRIHTWTVTFSPNSQKIEISAIPLQEQSKIEPDLGESFEVGLGL